jgi:predicted porin
LAELQQLSTEGKAGGAVPDRSLGQPKEEKHSMNKKLMAVAVAGALGAPALAMAQASNTVIYGRANLGIDQYKATGSTAGSASDLKARLGVYDSGSRVGLRGSEDLGGGLRAVYVIETGVNIDTGNNLGQGNQANTSTGFWASRDSYGGLEGNWGRVSFGRQSMFWTNGTIAQSGANYVNVDVPMATVGGGFGRIAGVGTRFNSTVMYTLPTLSGFGGYVGYSAQAESQQGSATVNPNSNTEAIRGTYEGRVKVQLDWAKNKGNSGAGLGGGQAEITGMKVGFGFPYMPGGQISLIWGQNQNKNVTTGIFAAGDTVKQQAYIVNWEHIFGPIQALAMYGKLNKATGCGNTACDNLEATSYMVGAKYLLSKRTGAYFTYNATTNKSNQTLDYTAAGITNANTLPAGADPKIFALGVIHNF